MKWVESIITGHTAMYMRAKRLRVAANIAAPSTTGMRIMVHGICRGRGVCGGAGRSTSASSTWSPSRGGRTTDTSAARVPSPRSSTMVLSPTVIGSPH